MSLETLRGFIRLSVALLALVQLFCASSWGRSVSPLPGQSSDSSVERGRFIEKQESVVRDVADTAAEVFSRRLRVRECSCSLLACSAGLSNMSCYHHLERAMPCEKDGVLLDNTTSMVRLPRGVEAHDLTFSVKENICLSAKLDDVFRSYGTKELGWIYFGSANGHLRSYPARLDPTLENDERGNGAGCEPYDPRLRPWYIGAITGPKDVVIVVDKSVSMDVEAQYDGSTRWNITTKAVKEILDTFTLADFVNIVTFSNTSAPLWKESGLARARAEHLEALKKLLDEEEPEGQTNFTDAFSTAFRLLTEHCEAEEKGCSDCQKIILFLTDGSDTSVDGESIKPSEMAKRIDRFQRRLRRKTDRRATIFTFSMSKQADDAIPRQIACANDGSWSFIGPNTNTLDALNSYSLYLAAGRRSSSPVWIEPYLDFSGLGNVTTVSLPVYSSYQSNAASFLIGVAAHDIPLSELKKKGFDPNVVFNEIIDRSEKCSITRNTPCDLQFLRNHTQNEMSVCPDIYRTHAKGDKNSTFCYERSQYYYKRISEEMPWRKARDSCEEDGGELVSIRDSKELAFVANMASPDGSWVGLQVEASEQFTWIDGRAVSKDSRFWGINEPNIEDSENELCGAIDSRGVIRNLKIELCTEALSFVCKYDDEASCGSKPKKVPKQGFKVPPLASCSIRDEESDLIGDIVGLKSADVICDTGEPLRAEDAICCKESGNGLDRSVIIPVIVLGSVGFAVSILCMAAFAFRRQFRSRSGLHA